MSISDEIQAIKEKYTNNDYEPEKLTPCSSCKHPETKYCLMCEDCGRHFEYGRLVKEAEEK